MIFRKFTKIILSQNPIKFSTYSQILYSIKKNPIGGLSLVENVTETDNAKMYVAWHPDVEFPYELTRPVPEEATAKADSLLRDATLETAMQAYRNKHPEVARQELMNLTFTTKHRWYPRSRDKKAKKTPMDRKYL